MCLFALMPLCVPAASINYQGRFTAGGNDYTGPVWLKARAISMFSESLWASDGSPGTNEPAGSVQIEANGGLFNIELGNPAVPGMTAMDWKVFRDSECSLRIWLSTNGTTFERLSPDVSVRPATFEKFSSGRTLFVDDSDSADFRDLQSALNAVYNDEAESIILLPGWYPITAPLAFSTQRFVNITGWGNRDEINIECTNGPAMFPHGVTLENISVSGSPAVSDDDASVPASYRWEAHHCVFRNNSSADPGSAALDLKGDGEAVLFDCRIENNAASSGPALLVGGSAELSMNHCDLFAGSGAGAAAQVTGNPGLRAISCDFFSEDDLSLSVQGPSGAWMDVQDSRLQNGIYLCSSSGVNTAGGRFQQCNIGNNSGSVAVNIDGGCGWMNFDNCEIWARGAHGIHQYSGLGSRSSVQVQNSRISVEDAGGGPAHAVFTGNHSGNNPEDASMDLNSCNVSAQAGRGINGDHAQIQLVNTRVQSTGNYAINCDNSNLSMEYSYLQGYSGGILAADSEIEVSHSSVEGDDYGMRLEDCQMEISDSSVAGSQKDGILAYDDNNASQLFVSRSDIVGSDSEEGSPDGSAIATSFLPGDFMVIFHSTLESFSAKPTLNLEGGINFIEESAFMTEKSSAATLKGTTTYVFDHCKFINTGESNTNALVQLCAEAGAPINPVINGCVFRTLFGTGSPAVGMSASCSATNNSAIMADCYLGGVTFNTNVISLIPVDDTTLPYGNTIGY